MRTPGAYRVAEAGPGCTRRIWRGKDQRSRTSPTRTISLMNSRCRCRVSVWAPICTPLWVTGKGPPCSMRGIPRSAPLLRPVAGLEIALRNAMHRGLAERYGEAWYDNRDAALDKARWSGSPAPERSWRATAMATIHPGLWRPCRSDSGSRCWVREAAFGTGRKANYEMTLWRPALRGAFAHRATLTRKEVHRPLNALRTLRNRIAHHEPVFARDLARDHERIVEVVGWITPGIRRWVEHHSRVPAILDTAIDAGAIRF